MNDSRVLLVDDEPGILQALKRCLHREQYQIETAGNAQEALEQLKKRPFKLIISDNRMPGKTGIEFFKSIRDEYPEIIKILLTGCGDLTSAVEAINEGGVHRYLLKPWDDNDLKITIRNALENLRLREENAELFKLTRKQNLELGELNKNLEKKVEERTREIQEKNSELEKVYQDLKKNFVDMIRAFASLIEMRNSTLGFHSKRVAAFAKSVAQKMKLSKDEILEIEIAAILHDIGKIGIQDAILEDSRRALSNREEKLLANHPIVGQACLQTIPNLEKAGILVRHHHENFNGTGFPDQMKGDAIPIGSRILAVADKFDYFTNPYSRVAKKSKEEAVTHLKKLAITELDPKIVSIFIDFIQGKETVEDEENEIVVSIKDLRSGMVLSRDLYTASEILLIAKDDVILPSFIKKIENFNSVDPIEGGIYIYKNPELKSQSA